MGPMSIDYAGLAVWVVVAVPVVFLLRLLADTNPDLPRSPESGPPRDPGFRFRSAA